MVVQTEGCSLHDGPAQIWNRYGQGMEEHLVGIYNASSRGREYAGQGRAEDLYASLGPGE